MTARPSHADPFRAVEEALAALSGQEFFDALVRLLADTLSAHCAFVVEFTNARTSAAPLAFWCDGKLIAASPYPLAGTPCECVLAGDIVGFERNVADLFPEDRLALQNIGAESFLAIPLKDRANGVVGHVAVIDRKRRDWDDADHEMLRLFAARATTEIAHRRFEQELEAARAALEAKMAERTRELEAANVRLQHEIERERELMLKLEDSEARYRSLFDNSPISIWEVDLSEVRGKVDEYRRAGVHDLHAHFRAHPDEATRCAQLLRVSEVNRATLSIYRATDAAVLRDWTNNVVLPESYGPLSGAIAELARGEQEGAMDIVHRTVDGERKNLAVRWSLMPGAELTWARVLCCVMDVTEATQATKALEATRAELEQRVVDRTAALSAANTRLRHEIASRLKAEQALREEEQRYRDLYENAPNVFYSVNTNGYIERANRQAERFFGCDMSEIVGHPVWNRMAPGPTGEGAARRAFNRFLEGKSTYGVEVEYRHQNGGSLWATLNVEPVLDAEGKPVVTRSVITDITARKLAETALERRRALEQLVTSISTSLAAATTDQLDRVLDSVTAELGAHRTWDLAVIERRRGMRLERKRHVWRAAGAPDRPLLELDRDRVLVPNVSALPLEESALRRTLERAGVQALVSLPLEHGDRVLGTLELCAYDKPHDNVIEDLQLITVLAGLIATTLVRCEAEDELVEARIAAEAASRAKSEFLANMSHELRTPLNAVLGYAQLLQRDASLAAAHQDAVRSVRRSGEHLLTLINDVLDLARVESGRVDIARREVDLRALVAEVDEMFRVRANEAGVAYRSTVTGDLPPRVWTDDRRIRQILINLLGNAMKFTPAGAAVALDVSAERTMNGARVRFDVCDAGIGIRQEDLQRIFEPFQQVGDARRDGAGLGLSITRELVHAMHGTIDVESELGRGSRFSVTLDLEMAATRPTPALPTTTSVTGYTGARRAVLVADDRAENRAILTAFLRPLGFEVTEATDGEAAVAAVTRNLPDLVFIDLVMPVIDGFEAVRRIRRLPGGASLKIVAISASAFEQTRSASISSGCDDFIVKPLNLERVLAVLADQLALSWIEAEANGAGPQTDSGPNELPEAALEALSVAAHSGDIMEIEALLAVLAREHGHGGVIAKLHELVRRFDVRGIESTLATLGAAR